MTFEQNSSSAITCVYDNVIIYYGAANVAVVVIKLHKSMYSMKKHNYSSAYVRLHRHVINLLTVSFENAVLKLHPFVSFTAT